MTRTAIRSNKFAADCTTCGTHIPADAGHLARVDGAWAVTCATPCTAPTPAVTFNPATLPADQLAYLDAHGHSLFDADATLHAALVAGGFNPAPLRTAPVRTTRRSTRRRKACVTGGNCASHTGRNCGGNDCDAN